MLGRRGNRFDSQIPCGGRRNKGGNIAEAGDIDKSLKQILVSTIVECMYVDVHKVYYNTLTSSESDVCVVFDNVNICVQCTLCFLRVSINKISTLQDLVFSQCSLIDRNSKLE